MEFSMNRIVGEILQSVVHPAHIPFQAEAQTAEINRSRDHGPRRGFLGEGLDARIFLVRLHIELAKEFDGFQILAAAIFVGEPFAGFARIIEIQHGRDRVYSQSVDVIFIQPEHCA